MSHLYMLGNWKMNLGPAEAQQWCEKFLPLLVPSARSTVGIFPPFPSLPAVRESLLSSDGMVQLGAQNCHWDTAGAFTGESSANWMKELGCRWILVGHSERRCLFGETDAVVRRKLETVLAAGLEPVLCIGETIEEREGGQMEQVLKRQLSSALDGLPSAVRPESGLLVAYEPVWAIGTGKTATPDQAEAANRFLKKLLQELGGSVPVIYGGSVTSATAAELMTRDGIDGALVGGASLDPAGFADLIAKAVGPTT